MPIASTLNCIRKGSSDPLGLGSSLAPSSGIGFGVEFGTVSLTGELIKRNERTSNR
jgi:hypothetical protein